ncbi:MAG: hypothetical protein ACK4SY_10055 [Pyrobaculum sp.]
MDIQSLLHLLALLLDLPLLREPSLEAYQKDGDVIICIHKAQWDLYIAAVGAGGYYILPHAISTKGGVEIRGGRIYVARGRSGALVLKLPTYAREITLVAEPKSLRLKLAAGGSCPHL